MHGANHFLFSFKNKNEFNNMNIELKPSLANSLRWQLCPCAFDLNARVALNL